jgi:excisionase family DNA binding protein
MKGVLYPPLFMMIHGLVAVGKSQVRRKMTAWDMKGEVAMATMVASGEKVLLTVQEAAARLGLKRSTVYPLIMRGEIASVKVGKARRIPAWAVPQFAARVAREQGFEPPAAQ